MTININSYEQAPVKGQLDLSIPSQGVLLSGRVSASQATALVAGQAVKLDTASGRIPSFLAAAKGDAAIGFVTRDVKKSSPVAGDVIQVACHSCVMWMYAAGTIAAQATVENTDDGNDSVQTKSAQVARGIALDPATVGQLFRVLILNPVLA
jgi:hypothetical protein